MPPIGRSRRGPRAIPVAMPGGEVTVYANARVADALEELTAGMTLYHGVRFFQVAQAIYDQGTIDGRRQVFDELNRLEAMPALRHRNPGRPRKTTAKKTTAKKAIAKTTPAKKAIAKKTPAKKAIAKKTPAKKAIATKATRRAET
jgi:hypothetical protein